jgi:hypothetical protein
MTDLPNTLGDSHSQVNTTQQTVPVQPIPTPIHSVSQPIAVSVSSVGGKEKGIIPTPEVPVEEVGVMPELGSELKEVGVEQVSETVDLPQPVSESTGMTHIGPTTPVVTSTPLPVKVPLTDDQIQKALHQKVADSILWLAYWCMRQVKMAQAKITRKEII